MKDQFPRAGATRAGTSSPGRRNGSDGHLREQARRLIQAGVLPGRRPDRVWGGPGGGASCAVCGDPVAEDQVEMELEFIGEDDTDPTALHVHLACFAALERERRKLEDPARTKKGAPKPGRPGTGRRANGGTRPDRS